MKVLIVALTYGNRPLDILLKNLQTAGYPFNLTFVSKEGIANAMNEGIHQSEGFDAIAILANDITEPENWLKKKVEALQTYPNAGIVASSLHYPVTQIQSEHIISNWLISKKVIEAIGLFNESLFPYGPIDLDYCERTSLAGFNTYYVIDCHATHEASYQGENEYGWNKLELVNKYWSQYSQDVIAYKNGTKSIKYEKI
jgi:GT2 family glycosyltransferase